MARTAYIDVNLDNPPVSTVTLTGIGGVVGSGDKTFSKSFTSATAVIVDHNLAKFPSVTVVDSAGDEVEGTVSFVSASQCVVAFSSAFSGVIYCN